MRKKLAFQGIMQLMMGISGLGILMFLPAGTFDFPGAWRMIITLYSPMLVLGTILLFSNPELMAKRLSHSTSDDEKKAGFFFLIVFSSCFLVCGLDFRFGWSHCPLWLSAVGCVLLVASCLCFAELLRENEFLSRTVEIQEGQKVISTGFYGIVRHPMYSINFMMYVAMPLVAGSFVGLIPIALTPIVVAKRIINEEKVLAKNLDGYEEYKKKVRYRLIPLVW